MRKKVVVEAFHQLHGSVDYRSGLTYMAKKNRYTPTKAEEIMWQKLLRYRNTGYKFTRQKPIDRFILDFYCSELNMAIEIDGGSHNKKKEYDFERDRFLSQIGIVTLRFTNEEILNDLSTVRIKILKHCNCLPCQGEVSAGRWG